MGSVANGRYCCVDGQIVPHFFNLFLPPEVLVPNVLVLGHRGRCDSTSTSPDVTVASASIANTALTLVFAEMVMVCTRARTKGTAAPGFCAVRPCRQSIEVSRREHIHAIPT